MRPFRVTRVRAVLALLAANLAGEGAASAQTTAQAGGQTAGPETGPLPVPFDLMKTRPSGVTAEQVGARAAQTSFTAKAAEENLRGAAARVDAAWAGFLPRLTGTARYTRLSDFAPPALTSSGFLVGTTVPPGQPITNPAGQLGSIPNIVFPLILDNYLLQANITVPISDYFLRIAQNYSAATNSQAAYRYDAVAARARSAADGKIAYYTWMRARGAVIVAIQALNDQRIHYTDAKNQFTVGNASKADVLRAETAVASAELAVVRARNLAELTEKQVRVAMHSADTDALEPGESVDTPPPPFSGNLAQLTTEALASRYEIKSIDANAESARQQASALRAGRYPVLSAFGDAIYANPNPRRFPATNDWFPTWDLGVQAIWSPNDILTASANGADYESRAAALEAQKGTTRDGIMVEMTQSYQAVKESDAALESTKRELASATEAYRVARELFNNGRATSTTLTDAETELTRARLDALNAAVDARIARVRLEHSLGRDTREAR